MISVAQAVHQYAAFLPEELRTSMRQPESSWWLWREMDVHLLRDRRPQAPVKVLAVHGAAAHSAAIYPVTALSGIDCEVVIPDLPLYGKTQVPYPTRVTYQDWVDLLCDLVHAEHDGRPLVLMGASVGGMLAYEVAARSGRADALVVTSLLDIADPAVLSHAARNAMVGRHAPRVLKLLRRWLDKVRVPVTALADTHAVSNDADLNELCISDPLGGGARIPLGFLGTWLSYQHLPPEEFTGPEILMVHPQEDHWMPIEISERFLSRVAAPSKVVMLANCGHLPVEQPGLDQLRRAVQDLAAGLTAPVDVREPSIDIRDAKIYPDGLPRAFQPATDPPWRTQD